MEITKRSTSTAILDHMVATETSESFALDNWPKMFVWNVKWVQKSAQQKKLLNQINLEILCWWWRWGSSRETISLWKMVVTNTRCVD